MDWRDQHREVQEHFLSDTHPDKGLVLNVAFPYPLLSREQSVLSILASLPADHLHGLLPDTLAKCVAYLRSRKSGTCLEFLDRESLVVF